MEDARSSVAKEIEKLREIDLPAALAELEEANQQGDASQNPGSFFALEQISRINGRIAYLSDLPKRLQGHLLPAGTVVSLDYGYGPERYVLSDMPGERDGLTAVTFESPLGKALVSARPGDEVLLGRTKATILEIIEP